MAEPTGLEPATSDVTGRRSNQLNYDSAFKISDLRFEISEWWARRDSNPQPLPCKGSRLPLTYVPVFKNPFEMTASRRTAIVRKSNEEVKTCSAADCHGSAACTLRTTTLWFLKRYVYIYSGPSTLHPGSQQCNQSFIASS